MSVKEWEDKWLADPMAAKVSGEHGEHVESDPEFTPLIRPDGGRTLCKCKRCTIIRIKKRRASRFPMTKCPGCGELFFSIYKICQECRAKVLE